MNPGSQSRILISYSHDSTAHRERVLSLAWALRGNGVDVELDQFHNEEIVDWPRWCSEQTSREHSDFVVCVCTAEYRRRIEGKVPPTKGKGVYWEGSLLDDDLYDEKGNSRLIPILLDDEPESSIPRFLRGWTHCRLSEFALKDDGYEHLLRILTKQARVEKNPLGPVPVLPTKSAATGSQSPVHADFDADISHILKYAPATLIGREDELKLLNDAWARVRSGEPKRPHVLTFVALGGEGKTSLVAKWAAELAAQDWPGCDGAFAWSFYSQGTREQMAASSDLFLKEALTFFGDEAMAGSAAGAFEKGRRLAHLVGKRRALLILDGLEPLQYAPSSPTPGELKDQGIAALLKGLAAVSHGLCIVTTRYSLPDLKAFWQTTAPEVKLLRLSRDAGVHLLKTLGVRGTGEELATLVEDVKGHALTLTLLGGFLKRAFHGDIRQRDRVKFEKADEKMDGGHAFRTMAAYEQWLLRDGGDEGRREVAVLRLMGLFDRPADAGCLAALRGETIPGLTEPFAGLADDDWEFCLTGLEAAKLLTVSRDAAGALVSLDAHPHIREYFAKQLREQNPDAWRAAHRRLYEHLCKTILDKKPNPTLEDLQPLYSAVRHACLSKAHQVVFDNVYSTRILGLRGKSSALFNAKNFATRVTKTLGAFGMELDTVHCFHDDSGQPDARLLSRPIQNWLVTHAAICLRGNGMLGEAAKEMKRSLDHATNDGDTWLKSFAAGHLSEIESLLGNLSAAIQQGELAVAAARDGADSKQLLRRLATLGWALFQAGRVKEAGAAFDEASKEQEELHRKQEGEPKHLCSLGGFQAREHLLASSEAAGWKRQLGLEVIVDQGWLSACKSAEKLAELTSQAALNNQLWMDAGLDYLILARARLYGLFLAPSDSGLARETSQWATDYLGKSHATDHIPRGLLTHAWLRFLTGACTGPESAQADLDEAWEIAERGPMRLHMADIHLYRARLFFREKEYPWNKNPNGSPRGPKDDLDAAEKLINDCGYHRRDEELADAKRAILGS